MTMMKPSTLSRTATTTTSERGLSSAVLLRYFAVLPVSLLAGCNGVLRRGCMTCGLMPRLVSAF